MKSRSAFTLIEILIATLLVGVGLSAVIGTVMVSIQNATQASRWALMGPIAQSALDYAVGQGLITKSQWTASLPDTSKPYFESPWAIAIDDDPANQIPGGPGGLKRDESTTAGRLKTFRIRVYDSIEDRNNDVRVRGTFLCNAYLRR